MGRHDFLKKIKIDLDNYKIRLEESKLGLGTGIQRMKKIHGIPDDIIRLSQYNLKNMYQLIINNRQIDYSINNFLKDIELFSERTDTLRSAAFDIDKLESPVSNNQIKDGTFMFIVLHFYAANFDHIINFLKPLAKEIQKTKKYTETTNKGVKTLKVKKAQTVLEVFRRFRPSFYYYLCRFLDRDLRNAIAHEYYQVSSDGISYKNKFIKKRDFFIKSPLIGIMFNSFQAFEYENRIKIYEHIVKEKMSKQEIGHLLKKYVV